MPRRSFRWGSLGLTTALLALLAGGVQLWRSQERQLQRAAEQELSAIARLKLNQIEAWRADQLAEGRALVGNPTFVAGVIRFLQHGDPDDEALLRARFAELKASERYADVVLLDPALHVRLSLSGRTTLRQNWRRVAGPEGPQRDVVLTDFDKAPGESPEVSIAVNVPLPVATPGAAESPATIILEIDPHEVLYPLIQLRPTPSRSAETLLVRRDGSDVLYLSDPRGDDNVALTLRRPVSDVTRPAVMATLGRVGLVNGVDYSGEHVLAFVQPVPGSPWFLVTQVASAEVLAEWRGRARLLAGLMLAALGLAVFAALALRQRRDKAHYQQVYEAEIAHRATLEQHAEALRTVGAAHERLVTAIHQAAEAVVITDPDGTIQYVNPAFEQITGYTSGEAIGQNPRILKSGKQGPDFYRDLWATISGGQSWQGRLVNKRKDGEVFVEEATISPVRDAAGAIVNYVAVKRDVTRELDLQAQLFQAQKMESVGRLAGGVAHDFNNMLSVIVGYTELALAQIAGSDDVASDLQEVRNAALRSADLTRQLLAFARKQVIEPRILDLNDAVAGTLKMLRRLIGEEIVLTWRPGAGLWPILVDPAQLDQLLANLLVNARDAIRGAGTIAIETAKVTIDAEYCASHAGFQPGYYVLLVVSDDGCGMDKDVLSQVFEPFFTTKGHGTGLGLATVYGIVKQNNGFINVYSEPGHGTTFRIYLPRAETEATALDVAPAEPAPGQGETVLLVEDEPSLLKSTSRMLERLGYDVLAAGTPAAALTLVDEAGDRIALLVTDVVMPEMNGAELVERIRAVVPGLRWFFVSGYPADVVADKGVLPEGGHYLAKPFSAADLAAKVREVLGA